MGMIAGAVYGALCGLFPKAVQYVFAKLFETDQRPALYLVVLTALAIPAYFFVRGLLGYLNTYYLMWVGSRAVRDLRMDLFTHLEGLSLDYFMKVRVPMLIQLVHTNTAMLQNSLFALVGDLVKQPVTILSGIAVLAYINPWFCVVAAIMGGLCLLPMMYFGRKARKTSRGEQLGSADLIGLLHETFSNIRVVKAYLLEETQHAKFHKATGNLVSLILRMTRQREILGPLIEVIASLGIMGALLYVHIAQVKLSEFLAIVAGFYMMYEPLKKLGRIHVQVQHALGAADGLVTILDTKPSVVESPQAKPLTRFQKEIRFENVSMEYLPGRQVLSDVSLTIPQGTVCALVGPSGAGKTTIINLLMRFYDPSHGRITIDGHDLRDLQQSSIRQLAALVTQETLLFADTVANNIGQGRPGASREEIIAAARRAHAHDFILAMPQGYDTKLSDRGQNLSGGQRQRLAIARAILRDPAILVLDEATNALDAESEVVVQEALNQLMKGRTTIVIAHRLSTIQHADQIVLMDQGRIVATGRHEELVAKSDLYRRLSELQFLPV